LKKKKFKKQIRKNFKTLKKMSLFNDSRVEPVPDHGQPARELVFSMVSRVVKALAGHAVPGIVADVVEARSHLLKISTTTEAGRRIKCDFVAAAEPIGADHILVNEIGCCFECG
jgi:hypothetical protein